MTIIEKVAQTNGVTPAEAKREMEAAIRAAGLDVSVETFIKICAKLVQQKKNE